MDELYAAGLRHPNRQASREAVKPSEEEIAQVVRKVEEQTSNGKEDVMLLQRWNGKLIAEAFHLSEMEIEIERAVEQVEKAIKAKNELVVEKEELEQASVQKTDAIEEKKSL
jgi:hypothetical protein